MIKAVNQADITNEVVSLLLRKKNRAEKLLDITLEQQAFLDQGYIEEFLTLMHLRQEIIDEIDSISEVLGSYSGINTLTLDSINPSLTCITIPGKSVAHFQEQKEMSHTITIILKQIQEINADIAKIYLQVQDLEAINKKILNYQLDSLKRELILLQNSKAGQALYDQLPLQNTGAFLDRKK